MVCFLTYIMSFIYSYGMQHQKVMGYYNSMFPTLPHYNESRQQQRWNWCYINCQCVSHNNFLHVMWSYISQIWETYQQHSKNNLCSIRCCVVCIEIHRNRQWYKNDIIHNKHRQLPSFNSWYPYMVFHHYRLL